MIPMKYVENYNGQLFIPSVFEQITFFLHVMGRIHLHSMLLFLFSRMFLKEGGGGDLDVRYLDVCLKGLNSFLKHTYIERILFIIHTHMLS